MVDKDYLRLKINQFDMIAPEDGALFGFDVPVDVSEEAEAWIKTLTFEEFCELKDMVYEI